MPCKHNNLVAVVRQDELGALIVLHSCDTTVAAIVVTARVVVLVIAETVSLPVWIPAAFNSCNRFILAVRVEARALISEVGIQNLCAPAEWTAVT